MNLTNSLAILFVALCTMILLQCASPRKSVPVVSGPDVSQAPTLSDTLAHSQENASNDAVVTMGSPDFYFTSDTSRRYDSVQTKPNAISSTPRILHISARDFSIYDTPHDSVLNRMGEKNSKDSTKQNFDTDVGILSPSAVQNLTLNLAKTEIVVLSLVSKQLFENFDADDLEKKFAQYGAKYVRWPFQKMIANKEVRL